MTDALKKYRFPVFAEEKFMGETVVFIPVYREYKCFVRNDSICVCEYLNGGLTKQGRKLRIDNPLGGMQNSLQYINNDIKLKLQIKNTLLFVAYSNFAREKEMTLYFPIDGFMLSAAFPASCCIFYGAISMI